MHFSIYLRETGMVVLLKSNHVEVLPWWHSGKESEPPVSRNFTGIRSGQEIPETAAHKMLWSEGLNPTSTAFPYPKWGLLTQSGGCSPRKLRVSGPTLYPLLRISKDSHRLGLNLLNLYRKLNASFLRSSGILC